nr:pre-mRNA splicing Prp18-interacting factor [Tanacetum cinerariifolium]
MSSFVLSVGCGAQLYGFSPCQWCACERCGNDLQNGFCSLCNSGNSYVYDPNPNSFDFPPDSYHPPHPTYETYSYDSYGNDSQFGYDCQPQFSLHYESEQGYNENYNSYPCDSSSFPQQYLCCARCGGPHETCQCDQLIFDEPYCKHCGGPHMNFHNLEYRDEIKIAELKENFNGMSIEIRKKEKLLQEEQWAYLSTHPFKRLTSFYFDDDDEDYTSAITPNEPVLSTEEPDTSLSMGDEHLDTILATESDEFIKSGVENLIPIPSEYEGIPEHMCDVPSHDNSPPLDVSTDQFEDFFESNEKFSSIDDDSFSIDDIDYVEASPSDYELVSSEVMEIVIPEVRGIDDDILLTINHDDLREKLLNVNLLIAKTEALNANPTPSFDCKTKSSSTSLNSLLEETNTFDNSLPEFETFCFDVEEISSGSTTTHPDLSLPEYEVFHDDDVKEISSSSPTTHSDSSLYASFMFDLSINPFPPADRSDSYEFTDELIPFISPPEYDCFLFKVKPNSRDFTKDVVENISPTKEPQVLTALPTHPTLQLNMNFQSSSESLFTYVVWIFLPFLVYSVVP